MNIKKIYFVFYIALSLFNSLLSMCDSSDSEIYVAFYNRIVPQRGRSKFFTPRNERVPKKHVNGIIRRRTHEIDKIENDEELSLNDIRVFLEDEYWEEDKVECFFNHCGSFFKLYDDLRNVYRLAIKTKKLSDCK